MPRFEFRHSPTESIQWTFDRAPEIGEEIVLGDRGVFRVIGLDESADSSVDAEYAVGRVRDATYADVRGQLKRGVNRLPPRG